MACGIELPVRILSQFLTASVVHLGADCDTFSAEPDSSTFITPVADERRLTDLQDLSVPSSNFPRRECAMHYPCKLHVHKPPDAGDPQRSPYP